MATTRLGADNTGDSGPVFKIIVRLCGLAAVAGIFLPFIGGQSILDYIRLMGIPGSKILQGTTTMGTITSVVQLSGYVFFPLIGLLMAIRGKYAGGPFTFLLLFNLVAFLLVMFFGAEAGGTSKIFFLTCGLGYWISCGGLFAPFVAMFFADKSI